MENAETGVFPRSRELPEFDLSIGNRCYRFVYGLRNITSHVEEKGRARVSRTARVLVCWCLLSLEGGGWEVNHVQESRLCFGLGTSAKRTGNERTEREGLRNHFSNRARRMVNSHCHDTTPAPCQLCTTVRRYDGVRCICLRGGDRCLSSRRFAEPLEGQGTVRSLACTVPQQTQVQ